MGSQVLSASLKDVFKHSDFKSKLQKEAVECIHGGRSSVKLENVFSIAGLCFLYTSLEAFGLIISSFCIR